METVAYFIFLGSKITVDDDYSHEIKTNQQTKTLDPCKEGYDKPRLCIKKQRYHFDDKDSYSQSYGFSSSHEQIWELDHKESWALKNWWFWIVVLEKTFESLLDCMEIKPVNPKGNQPWKEHNAAAEAPVLWPPDAKTWLIGKAPDIGKDWGQKEKGAGEDEMFR